MKYKLLATDMDGTLLNSGSIITERTRKAILAAMERGVLFVPSTGRPLRRVKYLSEIFPGDFPIIIFNGARVMTSKSEQVLLFSQSLDLSTAKEIYAQGRARGFPIILWEGETLYASHHCEEAENYWAMTGMQAHIIESMDAFRDITKMIWLIPPEDGPRLRGELDAHFGGRINYYTSQSQLLEFTHTKASKGLALEAVGKAYGIAQSEMIAVGDGYNDVSMLEYAGLGVAMGNAPEDIKGICQHVTLSNDEDGVAAVIEKYFLGGSI